MKLLHTITSLAICSLSFAFGEEQPELAEVEVVPVPQDEIICEFPGRVFKPETEAIPKGYADEKAIAIKLESLVRNKGAYEVKFRIINPTTKPMTFTGYSEKSPLTDTQYWKDGKWVDPKPVGICGTGLRQCTIPPGQSAVFQAYLQGDKLPARVGLTYAHGGREQGHLVWSEKIER